MASNKDLEWPIGVSSQNVNWKATVSIKMLEF